MPARMPAVFFGHGNPMNALAQNEFTQGWSNIGLSIPRPRAVLMVSAHWQTRGTAVTALSHPRTIHDFGGFPPALYEVQYAAPGDLALAKRVKDLLAPLPVTLDQQWGLDHGTWSVLCHTYPAADVPIVQLSLDVSLAPAQHFALAQRLAPLRNEGVLIAGSGNLIHNLRLYAWGNPETPAYDWAADFETRWLERLAANDIAALIDYASFGAAGKLAVPTEEHYLPLLYVLAVQQHDEAISFPVKGFEGGSLSMLSLQVGR